MSRWTNPDLHAVTIMMDEIEAINKHVLDLFQHTVILSFIYLTKVILSYYIRQDSLLGVVFLTTFVRLGAESTRTNRHDGTRIYLLIIIIVVYILNNHNAARVLTFHSRGIRPVF